MLFLRVVLFISLPTEKIFFPFTYQATLSTMMFVKNNFKYSVVNTYVSQIEKKIEYEYTCINVFFNNVNFMIICVYRSPKVNFDVSISRIMELVDVIMTCKRYVDVCGDINIDLLVVSLEKLVMEQTLLSHDLHARLTEITRPNPRGEESFLR